MRRFLSHFGGLVRGGLLFLGCLLVFQIGLDRWHTFQQLRAMDQYERAVTTYVEFVEVHDIRERPGAPPCLNWHNAADRATAERMVDLLLSVYAYGNTVRDYELERRNSDLEVVTILLESTDSTRESLTFLRRGLAGEIPGVPTAFCRDGGEITL